MGRQTELKKEFRSFVPSMIVILCEAIFPYKRLNNATRTSLDGGTEKPERSLLTVADVQTRPGRC